MNTKEYGIFTEMILQERVFGKVEFLYRYMDEWGADNQKFLFITGDAGSGKSTLANTIANKNQADVIHLDYVMNTYRKGVQWLLDRKGRMSSHHSDFPHELMYEFIEDNPNEPYGKASKDLNSIEFSNHTLTFLIWLENNLHKYPKYNHKKFVIEGVQLAYDNPELLEYLSDKPLIIIDAPESVTYIRKIKRLLKSMDGTSTKKDIELLFNLITKGAKWSHHGSVTITNFINAIQNS